MSRKSKRFKEIEKLIDPSEKYTLEQAIELLKKCPTAKFDESVEIALVMGVDPRKSDQHVRGTVSLPNGTGKTLRIVVLTSVDKIEEAKNAGADEVGNQELVDKIKGGWLEFDALVVSPDMMREVGKLGKLLGPRGLMPTPKAGTVTNDIEKAVSELKKGKVEFKIDKYGVIHNMVGKLSFSVSELVENIKQMIQAIQRAKPPSAKGHYLKSLAIASTMGPGLQIDLSGFEA